MQTSVPGCSDHIRRPFVARGFTLIELLVVMVIISIGIAVAVISLRPDDRGVAREEGARLAALLGLASEESSMGGMPLAWIGNQTGYQFATRQLTDQGPDWNVVTGDDLLHPRKLPSGTTIRSIMVDGQPVGFGQRVSLGSQVTQDVSVEIALGDAHVIVTGKDGRFESALATGSGS
jgi:general secretion pathway protein H